MNRTIITVVGKDTKGIIAKVCTYLAEKDVNILDIIKGYTHEDGTREPSVHRI